MSWAFVASVSDNNSQTVWHTAICTDRMYPNSVIFATISCHSLRSIIARRASGMQNKRAWFAVTFRLMWRTVASTPRWCRFVCPSIDASSPVTRIGTRCRQAYASCNEAQASSGILRIHVFCVPTCGGACSLSPPSMAPGTTPSRGQMQCPSRRCTLVCLCSPCVRTIHINPQKSKNKYTTR